MHATDHLRTFKLVAFSAIALIIGIAATGLAILLVPHLSKSITFILVSGLIVAVVLVALLLYSGYFSLRDSLKRMKASYEQNLASVHRDALTGALSRAYFLDELKARLRNADKEPLAFAQIDMDRLKQLNDGSGHTAGDTALQHLAATVERVLPDSIVGRLGGDEFGVIIPGHDNIQAISRVCRQMLDSLSEPTFIAGRSTNLSASVGFAVAPLHANHVDDLITKADLALYKGKSLGRNAVVAFDEGMHHDERHRRFIERELRAAIMMEELELHYQPILDRDGRSILAHESLVRWRHPVRGLIPPSDFISIAESSDLIDKLGDWVLRRACEDFHALGAPALGINVSPIQLRRPDFADRCANVLAEADIPPDRFIIEVTESVPLAEEGIETVNLDRLRHLGVSIAIDDFGSGSASLSYLKRAPFQYVKIDRSYVENVASSRFDALMIASVCRIAKAANMKVVAEGIENEKQMQIVVAAGVNFLQGFHLGRPQPLHAILAQQHASAPADTAPSAA